MAKISDPLGIAFMEFLEEQGITPVDYETGKPVTAADLKKRHTTTPKGKRIEK